MGKPTLVDGKQLFAWIGARFFVATVAVFAASACGGKSKDRTGETQNGSPDASVDAGDAGQQIEQSSLDASSLGTETSGDTANVNDSSHSETTTTATSTAPGSTTSTMTATENGTTATTDNSGTELRPDWVLIEPIAEGLSNCSAKLEKNDNFCVYSALCGTVSLASRCELQEDGWECTCERPWADDREYRLTGVQGTSACEASLVLCAPVAPREPTPVCDTEIDDISDDTCAASEHCRTTVPLGDGVTAHVVEKEGSSACSTTPADGTITCTCGDSNETATMYGLPLEEACKTLVPLCKAGLPAPNDTIEADAGPQ